MLAALSVRHGTVRIVIVAAVVGSLLAGVLATPAAGQTADTCVAAFPVRDVRTGQTASGLTVTRANQPEPFTAEVIGVLSDGIAPGVDMIVADVAMDEVQRAGIWAGISGSPVYADDGRLLGAISYSLAFDPSSIAGITPAAQMAELYDYPGSTRALAMEQEVRLPAALRQRAASRTDATAGQLRQGMRPIPVPVGISGLGATRLDELEQRLEGRHDLALYSASRAQRAQAAPGDVIPGSNFVAALSYGDLTSAGLGTTTDVCDGMALAFGHPFLWSGRTAMSTHTADALYIQPDAGFGISFKVANPGGIVGTVDQDRLTGIRARLGAGPDPSLAWSRVASLTTGQARTGRTWINRDLDVPFLAPFHLLVNLDRVFDRIGEGRSLVTWTVTGTHSAGTAWKLTRSNRFASGGTFGDVSFASITEMLNWLSIINNNRYTDVTFDDVRMRATADEAFQQYRVGAVRAAVNRGRFRRLTAIERLRVNPRDLIRVQVPLIGYREAAASRTVSLRVRVPRGLEGRSATLGVFGGQTVVGERNPSGGRSFVDILRRMRQEERNNDVLVRLQRDGGRAGPRVFRTAKKALGDVVHGRRTVRVVVR